MRSNHVRTPLLIAGLLCLLSTPLFGKGSASGIVLGAPPHMIYLPAIVTGSSGLNPDQKRRAEQLTSLFENGTIEIQYGYAEALGDGRGITAGRAGFTTATGDAFEVVQLYTNQRPGNLLAPYLPELERLAAQESDDISGLSGFINAWQAAASDPLFRAAQDTVVDTLYYQPSAQHANQLGVQTALARAVLYDTIIQHGDGDDLDGLPALLDRTRISAGGTPKTGVDEKIWLKEFIKIRRADLAHAYDPETRDVWAESVGRCDVFSAIATAGNYDLHGPIVIHTAEYDEVIP
jgi:chitosanase